NMGQFERTLIIAEEGSSVHYVEGCTAPVFSSNTLHSAVVEIIVQKDADVRYTTIQNWSHKVYNIVNKRAVVQEGGRMTSIAANLSVICIDIDTVNITRHSAIIDINVKKDANVRYTTIQNWSHNVYNLVTKRAVVQEGGRMTWIDANLGSKVTMKYPSVYLVGERAHGEVLSVAFAGNEQHQDAGAKMIHAAPNTTSIIQSKGISKGTGQQTYRGMVKI